MFDLLLDINFDLKVSVGDLVVGESTRQHQQLLLLAEKGEFREFPARGIGAQSWLLDDIQAGDFAAAVKKEFEADGMKVLLVKGAQAGKLQIEASYV